MTASARPVEPLARLSLVFPGPVRLDLERLRQEGAAATLAELCARSRLCEHVWLDEDLFEVTPAHSLFATSEEAYQAAATAGTADRATALFPGCLGEQFLLRDVDLALFSQISPPARMRLADCELEFRGIHQGFVGGVFPIFEFRLLEGGLAEPGAALHLMG